MSPADDIRLERVGPALPPKKYTSVVSKGRLQFLVFLITGYTTARASDFVWPARVSLPDTGSAYVYCTKLPVS
jgi:hypothetical protein